MSRETNDGLWGAGVALAVWALLAWGLVVQYQHPSEPEPVPPFDAPHQSAAPLPMALGE